ncbi:MAG TPA: AAA family ATPase [Candidatus Limnocylindrales bacterium]|nr:AAA family ATPase [Candidatus Limnocylindrales bacterium]
MADQIVGRDAELEATSRFLLSIAAGPGALVIAGEPGIGKTTLWRTAVALARESGCLVLESRPLPADVRVSYTSLADLLRDLPDSAFAALPHPQAHGLRVVLRRAEPSRNGLDRRAVAAGFMSLVADLARTQPVVIAMDDVQWMDRPSARVVEHVSRRLSGSRVGLLMAVRREAGADTAVGLSLDASVGSAVVEIPLAGLDRGAIDEVLRARLGRAFPRRVRARIHEASGGNPLFALEMARTLPDPPPVGPLAAPRSVRELVNVDVRRLPAESREVLLAIAALGAPPRALVLAAASVDGASADRGLELAEDAGVIVADGGIRFSHPLLASAVYGAASRRDRRRMHRRLAELVTDPEARARHLALGTIGPDEAVAAELAAAAEVARSRGAPDAAAELAERAIVMTPPERTEERRRRTIEAAEYHLHSGELPRAREAIVRLLEEPIRGRERGRALRLLADIRNHQDSFSDAIDLYREALAHAADDAELEATIELGAAWATVAVGELPAAVAHAQNALHAARATNDPTLLAEALAVDVMVGFLVGRGLDEVGLAEALRLEDRARRTAIELRPSLIAGYLRMYEGRFDEARRYLQRLRTTILERGVDADLPFVSGQLAWLEIWAGRLDVADGYVQECEDVAGQIESTSIRALCSAITALVRGWQGRPEELAAAAAAAESAAMATGWRLPMLWARWGRAIFALADDDPRSAEAALREMTAVVGSTGVAEPTTAAFVPDAIEALIALREIDRATSLLESFETAAIRLDRAWAQIAAARNRIQLLDSAGEADAAATLGAKTLADPRIADSPLEHARILLALGRAARRGRRRREANDALREAAERFARAGASHWAERALDEAARVGLVRAGTALTPSESRIASMVARGMTNRAVAERLLISPKTVEATLARAYAKLGISSRAELGAVMAREPDRLSPRPRP